jgi:hypothetical protein
MTLCTASGQSLYQRQTLLEKFASTAADIDDDVVLKRTLYAPLRPDDLAAEQCELFARNELKPLEEELDYRRRTLEMAASRARFIRELADMAKVEASFEAYQLDLGIKPLQERFDGKAAFSPGIFKKVVLAYQEQFGKPLPVSANGESAFHKALGYDHRGRVDVALSPDQPEGEWLRLFLQKEQVPYYAFRGAVAGKASAPHIHIGPPSSRLRVAD